MRTQTESGERRKREKTFSLSRLLSVMNEMPVNRHRMIAFVGEMKKSEMILKVGTFLRRHFPRSPPSPVSLDENGGQLEPKRVLRPRNKCEMDQTKNEGDTKKTPLFVRRKLFKKSDLFLAGARLPMINGERKWEFERQSIKVWSFGYRWWESERDEASELRKQIGQKVDILMFFVWIE